MMPRHIKHIEVGTHEQYVAIRLTYEEGTPDLHCFTPELAEQVANQLLTVIKNIRYIESQLPKNPSERSGVGESVTMRLSSPPEEV